MYILSSRKVDIGIAPAGTKSIVDGIGEEWW